MSWSPAVPPPPVCGATVVDGCGLAAEVGPGDCVCVARLDAVALAEEVALPLAGLLEVALPLAGLLEVALPEAGRVVVLVNEGGLWVGGGVEEDEDGEHPASATVRMAKTPKPMTVGFALSTAPAMVTRTVM